MNWSCRKAVLIQACTFSVTCDQRGIQKMKLGIQTKFSVRIWGRFFTHKMRKSPSQGEMQSNYTQTLWIQWHQFNKMIIKIPFDLSLFWLVALRAFKTSINFLCFFFRSLAHRRFACVEILNILVQSLLTAFMNILYAQWHFVTDPSPSRHSITCSAMILRVLWTWQRKHAPNNISWIPVGFLWPSVTEKVQAWRGTWMNYSNHLSYPSVFTSFKFLFNFWRTSGPINIIIWWYQ